MKSARSPGLVAGIDGVLVLDAAKNIADNEQNKETRLDRLGVRGQVKTAASPPAVRVSSLSTRIRMCVKCAKRHDAKFQSGQYRIAKAKPRRLGILRSSEVLSIFGGRQDERSRHPP